MEKKLNTAIYPGSFDPITLGHVDILQRALTIFDRVIILLATNPHKTATFSIADRLKMLQGVAKMMPQGRVEVDHTSGLTVAYAQTKHAQALVRGLRAVPDFEYEHDIFTGNQFINPDIEMVFLMSRRQHTFISSSMVKELYQNHVDVTELVPASVLAFLPKINKR
jgi:pantetheine-phosphate adenylyltransferase